MLFCSLLVSITISDNDIGFVTYVATNANDLKEYFTNKFKLLYPNYNISIEMFKETNYIDTLFKTPHRKRFFFREIPEK